MDWYLFRVQGVLMVQHPIYKIYYRRWVQTSASTIKLNTYFVAYAPFPKDPFLLKLVGLKSSLLDRDFIDNGWFAIEVAHEDTDSRGSLSL